MKQTTNHILMVRPANFGSNAVTANDNFFQKPVATKDEAYVKEMARKEFDQMVETLQNHQINVLVIEDTIEPLKTDAVFPNNWISTHSNGTLITYPMFAPIRRLERREDIIQVLDDKFNVKNRYSFEFYEDDKPQLFLEGTGSIVLDRVNNISFANISQRTDATLLDKFNVLMGSKGVLFAAVDAENRPIYHTNVMLSIGTNFAIICDQAIIDEDVKKKVLAILVNQGKEIVSISFEQMENFAANVLEVHDNEGKSILCMSQTAFNAFTPEQIVALERHASLLPISIPTIEKHGGGSVRCMMAEIFLTPKT